MLEGGSFWKDGGEGARIRGYVRVAGAGLRCRGGNLGVRVDAP
jgi:hypothetical protein